MKTFLVVGAVILALHYLDTPRNRRLLAGARRHHDRHIFRASSRIRLIKR